MRKTKFKPIVDRDHPIGMGWQKIYRFDNDLGASVIQTPYSYGGEQGLMELGIIKFTGDDWHLVYDTEITDDVIGYLNQTDVNSYLAKIKALPKDYPKYERD